jgi:protein required for attachment to host cells
MGMRLHARYAFLSAVKLRLQEADQHEGAWSPCNAPRLARVRAAGTESPVRSRMKRTWILVANGAHAQFFQRTGASGALEPLQKFECPQARAKGVDLESDRMGHEEMGHGRGSSSFDAHSGPRAKIREEFARDLARFVNEGIAGDRCGAVMLLASSPFLGLIKAHLSVPAAKVLLAAIDKDLTALDPKALALRLHAELPRASLQ